MESTEIIEVAHRLDRRNGRYLTIYVILFRDSPSSLTFGSWFRTAIQSQVKGYLRAKLNLRDFDVKIDTTNSYEMIQESPQPENVSVGDAVKRDLIEVCSPYYDYMKKFAFDYLVLEKGHILGPNIGLMNVVELLLDVIPYKEITDLFAGTGAITKVALKKGVERSVCVDLDISAARRNLSDAKDKVTFVQEDILKTEFSRFSPLVIADPTFPVCPLFIRDTLPRIRTLCETLVVGHGHPEHISWNRSVRTALHEHFGFIYPISSLAVEVTLCTNDENVFHKISSNSRFATMRSS